MCGCVWGFGCVYGGGGGAGETVKKGEIVTIKSFFQKMLNEVLKVVKNDICCDVKQEIKEVVAVSCIFS